MLRLLMGVPGLVTPQAGLQNVQGLTPAVFLQQIFWLTWMTLV